MTIPSSPRSLLIGLVIGMLVGFVACWVARAVTRPLPPPPALLAGPTGDYTDILQRRFPIGSPEANLVHELWREGFRPLTDLRAAKRVGEWDRPPDLIHDICIESERVEWTANAAGELTDLSGGRYSTCS